MFSNSIMKQSFNFDDIKDLLNSAPSENAIAFLDNCIANAKGEYRPLSYKSEFYDFNIDISDRLRHNGECKEHYRSRLLEIGFGLPQIQAVLTKYDELLPSFNQIVNEVMLQPQLRMLTESDFVGLSSEFSAEIRPNQIQQKILDNIQTLQAPAEVLAIVATGLGKTFLSIFAAEKFMTTNDYLLFVVNSTFIRDQAFERYVSYFKLEGTALNVQSDKQIAWEGQRFVFCLYQSLHLLPQQFLRRVTILVIDEVHHVLAPTYLQKIQQFDNLKLKLGLTATLTHQLDPTGQKIKELFRNNVACDLPWTVAKRLDLFPPVQYLEMFKPISYTISTNNQYETLKTEVLTGNAQVYSFKKEPNISVQDMASNLAKFFVQHPVKKTIIFLSSVREVEIFSASLTNLCDFIAVREAHYQVEKTKLQKSISEFRTCLEPIALVTIGMATEGYDLPDVDCVLMGRQTDSERLFVQQMGRCLRKSPNKERVYVLDMCGNLRQRWIRIYENEGKIVMTYIQEFWRVNGIE